MRYRCRCEGAGQRLGTATVEAADVNPAMIEVARSLEAHPPISWRQASAEALPFADVAYDAVLCQMGLQFFSDKLLALREARRVLRPRGRFLAAVPSPIPPLFTILAEQLEHHGQPSAARSCARCSRSAAQSSRSYLTGPASRTFPSPRARRPSDFPHLTISYWQYVTSTPLGAVLADLEETERHDFAREVVEEWRSFVKRGSLVLDLRLVLAAAVAP